MAEAAEQRAKEGGKGNDCPGRIGPPILDVRAGHEFSPACLESFRAQPQAEQAASWNFRKPATWEPGTAPRSPNIMSSVKATQLRPVIVIQHDGQLFPISTLDHPTPANKRHRL